VSREENHEKEHQTQASYPLENVRLLLVDDDDANCVVASSFLRKMGVKKVTTATNGEEALKIVQQMPFDIVLMDLQMPIMNGYEATQAIRQLGGIYQALPIIALTADVVSDVREKVLKAGMNDYLSKPFDPDELNAIIARHLNVASRPASPVAEVEEEELVTLRRILEKYRDDTQFTQALLTSVYNSYQELNQQVEEAVSRWDLISLRRTIHKMQPTLKMMENYQLQEKLMLLREQLSQKENGEDQLNAISSDIFSLTGESLRMLEELRMEWSDKETKVM
jgi:CheY-like chemotaxis protein